MKYLLFILLTGCQDFFYPADEYLDVPGPDDIRMHCLPDCPPHDALREALSRVADQMEPFTSGDPYRQWRHYALTFRDDEMFYREHQLLGITLHNRGAIGIWMPYDCGANTYGVCPGVLGWELKLALVEREIPYSNEQDKIDWLTARDVQHIDWSIE
jgi:hypothetical protein